jgi:putative phosphoribosyl transferase
MSKAAAHIERQSVYIPSRVVMLEADLVIPDGVHGVVAFAHGSGSSRHSRRNRYVAEVLQGAGLATLLLDLLTPAEAAIDSETMELRFDIDLLADRVAWTVDWLANYPGTGRLRIGLFGASTGAAAALVAAAARPDLVQAVVSRGGRPDLATPALSKVRAATLLIVGGQDHEVLLLNRAAIARMTAERKLEVVPGATHLFEEPGTLEEVARLAADWFVKQLRPRVRLSPDKPL